MCRLKSECSYDFECFKASTEGATERIAAAMQAGLEVERDKAAALSRMATAAILAHAPLELRQKIGEQEGQISLLENEIRIAALKKRLEAAAASSDEK